MMLISLRFIIAALVGTFVFNIKSVDKEHVKHSFILSLFLLVTYVFGVAGLKYTSASNAAFIVGSNVILVPLINKIFFKSTATKKDYIKSFICFIGLMLVTLKGTNPINIGDFYCFINAIGYSLYIIYNSHLSHDLDAKKLITLEYAFVGIPTLLYVLVSESFTISLDPNNIVSILILSLFCTFLAFYFQIKTQRYISSENLVRYYH